MVSTMLQFAGECFRERAQDEQTAGPSNAVAGSSQGAADPPSTSGSSSHSLPSSQQPSPSVASPSPSRSVSPALVSTPATSIEPDPVQEQVSRDPTPGVPDSTPQAAQVEEVRQPNILDVLDPKLMLQHERAAVARPLAPGPSPFPAPTPIQLGISPSDAPPLVTHSTSGSGPVSSPDQGIVSSPPATPSVSPATIPPDPTQSTAPVPASFPTLPPQDHLDLSDFSRDVQTAYRVVVDQDQWGDEWDQVVADWLAFERSGHKVRTLRCF